MANRKNKARASSVPIAILFVVSLTPAARAQLASEADAAQTQSRRAPQFLYGVDAGVGESDNVTLVSSDKRNQTIATTDADFSVKDQTRLLDVNATGNFSYLDYLQKAFGNQFLGRFDGAAKVAIVPGLLTWELRDDFAQASIDPYATQTPNNLENVDYLSTGPDLTLRFSAVTFLKVSARYARSQYGTSPFDSNRFLASASLGRDVSAGATVSLNVESERVLFENTEVNTDFGRSNGFARYELHGARTDFEADLGGTTIRQAGSSTSGVLAKLQGSRRVSPASKLTATAGRELTDASSSFATLQGGGSVNVGAISTAPAAQTSYNYTSDYASLGWQYQRNRTTLMLNARWEKDNYTAQPILTQPIVATSPNQQPQPAAGYNASIYDVTRPGLDLSLQRQLTRTFRTELVGRWSKINYPNARFSGAQETTESGNFSDWLVGGSLIWHHGRGLEVRLRYDHDSHVVAAGTSGYAENRVFLTIGYRPLPALQYAETE